MDAKLRAQKLSEIENTKQPYMTGIRLPFERANGVPYNAYKIPLEFLVYNRLNHRIGSLVKSFEQEYKDLDPENPKDSIKIEDFLWASKEDRNEKTMESLARDGQQKYGIVTYDGVIIDGNRRAFLLNRIYRDRETWQKKYDVEHCKYFIAVILEADSDPKEIIRLETMYQMGEDAKLDYNPIEKYLTCKDLHKAGFTIPDIANMMAEPRAQIEKWLGIMKLMDDYLVYLGYEGIYTQLDKREGQFVDLHRYLNTYKNGSNKVEWGYDRESDVADLKSVCFDYIRAQYEGKEFRWIAQPSKIESIFCKGEVWKKFLKNHEKNIAKIKERSIEELREENKDIEISRLLRDRDKDWKDAAHNLLRGNLADGQSAVENRNKSDKPRDLINKALEALSSIDTNASSFKDEIVDSLLSDIQKIVFDLRKLLR